MISALILLLVRGTLFWVLASAAMQKLGDRQRSAVLLRRRLGVSPALSRWGTWTLIASEAGLALGLLWPGVWPVAAGLTALLFAGFAGLQLRWLRGGQTGDCGCGGLLPLQDISRDHVVVVTLLALAAGGGALAGLSGLAADEPTGGLLGLKLLLLVLPLPVLLLGAAARQIIGQQRQIAQHPGDTTQTGVGAPDSPTPSNAP